MGIFSGFIEVRVPEPDAQDWIYTVTVESAFKGMTRLVVSRSLEDELSDDEDSSQGVDLTSNECRAVARYLLAAADLLDQNDDASYAYRDSIKGAEK